MVFGHSQYLRFLTTTSLQDRYWKQLCKSYTDLNNSIKWCPQKGCEYCFEQSSYNFQSNVDCKCGMSFCMLCSTDSHLPCDCTMALRWKEKFSAESENITWIMANTKTCPKCHKPIEKNAGCNHMTCNQCKYQFCWICMTDWSLHGTATGGAYKCNRYEEEVKKNVKLSENEARQVKAQSELKRYTFHLERYTNHDKAELLAIKLKPVLARKMEMLHNLKHYEVNDLLFLEQALTEVIRCRHVLKWTYAFGYFSDLNKQKRDMFEFSQESLEKYCEHLHGMVEKPLDAYIDPNIVDKSPFYRFKSDLVSFYTATTKFYQGMVKDYE